VNGLFFTPDWQVLPANAAKDFIFAGGGRVVFKADNSFQGKGIWFMDAAGFDMGTVQRIGNGVFQSYIEQHDFFEEMMPDSVATLRMTSVMSDTGVSCRAAYLRVGRGKDTHVKSSSAVKIAVDLASGELRERGYLPNWRSCERHPDTGVVFAGRVIPRFADCVALVEQLHRAIPYVRSVGWDVVVDKDGEVRVMEWNGEHNDIKFSEATAGPCFADMGWEKLWRM
jgi:hypothetical protein